VDPDQSVPNPGMTPQHFQAEQPNPTQVQPSTPSYGGAPPSGQKTSIWAILSIVFAFLVPLLGIIFGIVALVVISKDPGLKGKGLAIAGLIISVVWIPVILFFIGAIAYFGVLSPGNLLPMKCEFSAGLDCTETPSADASAGTITFPLTNSQGYEISGLSASSDICTGATFSQDTVKNGESIIVTLNGCDLKSEERYMTDPTITWTSGSTGMQHTTVGSLTGKAI